MTFLPQNYEVPQSESGKYFKPKGGENKVRVLTDCVLGWVYWNNQDKPVRLKDQPGQTPSDIRVKEGKTERIKHFWAMVVYDYATQQISIWEVTQRSIQDAIAALASDSDWGHPRQYDLKINRTGESLSTEYSVVPSPIKPPSSAIVQAYNETPVNLNALYDGSNPFEAERHSHDMNMSVADAVTAMVQEAKGFGVDVKTVCEGANLPIKASEYDEEKAVRLEEALVPYLAHAKDTAADADYDDIPF